MDDLKKIENFQCSICQNLLRDPCTGTCCHAFCRKCITEWFEKSRTRKCPLCRSTWRKITPNSLIAEIISKEFPNVKHEDCVLDGITLDIFNHGPIFASVMSTTKIRSMFQKMIISNFSQLHLNITKLNEDILRHLIYTFLLLVIDNCVIYPCDSSDWMSDSFKLTVKSGEILIRFNILTNDTTLSFKKINKNSVPKFISNFTFYMKCYERHFMFENIRPSTIKPEEAITII